MRLDIRPFSPPLPLSLHTTLDVLLDQTQHSSEALAGYIVGLAQSWAQKLLPRMVAACAAIRLPRTYWPARSLDVPVAFLASLHL